MTHPQARRLAALERDAPASETVFLWQHPGQTEAEVIAARYGTTPPAGTTFVIFSWQSDEFCEAVKRDAAAAAEFCQAIKSGAGASSGEFCHPLKRSAGGDQAEFCNALKRPAGEVLQ